MEARSAICQAVYDIEAPLAIGRAVYDVEARSAISLAVYRPSSYQTIVTTDHRHNGPSYKLCACRRPRDPENFRESHTKKSISRLVGSPWCVLEVESYVLSKFEPPTTLGGPQDVEKAIGK